MKLMYAPEENNPSNFVEGDSHVCTTMCWKDYSWTLSDRGQPCDEPQKPCKTMAEYVSHPLPRNGW